MTIGIIVAMRKELDLLLPLLEGERSAKGVNGYEFHRGRIGKHEIVAMQCGIGKVNAAMGTLTMIDRYEPELIINTGVAGGTDASMHVLDMLVAESVSYHDVWCGPETEYGAASGLDVEMTAFRPVVDECRRIFGANKAVHYGLLCSGDRFICTEEEVRNIKSHFPDALATDMEAGAIAQVCTLRGIPFNVLRVISDTPGQEENISQYENFWSDAPAETFKALSDLLKGSYFNHR